MASGQIYDAAYRQLPQTLLHLAAEEVTSRYDIFSWGSVRWGEGMEDGTWEYG